MFRNDTPNPIVLTDSSGTTVHLRAGFWERFVVTIGASIRLPDGTCLVVLDEPGLAVIEKLQPIQR